MGLENGRSLDYIKDESGEQKSLYEDNNYSDEEDEKLVSADDFRGSLDEKSDQIIANYKRRLDALRTSHEENESDQEYKPKKL